MSKCIAEAYREKPCVSRCLEPKDCTAMPLATAIIRDVAELPDRTSPNDQPDMMLVTADELRTILEAHL